MALTKVSSGLIGSIDASVISSGTVPTARLGSGTANSTTFLRGDGSWNAPAGGGAWTLIQTQTASSLVASVDFTTGIEGQSYKALILYCVDLNWSVNYRVGLRYKIGGSFLSTGYTGDWFGSDMTSGNNLGTEIWIGRCSGGHKFASTVTVFNPSGSTIKYATAVTVSSAGKGGIGHGVHSNTGEIQGIQVINADAGTVSGIFTLFGVK